MRPVINVLIVEDKIKHLRILLEKLFKITIDSSFCDELIKNGENSIKNHSFLNNPTNIYVCNNKKSALGIIDARDILFAFLDIYIPGDKHSTSPQLDEYGADVLEALHRDRAVFTFLNSSDRKSLNEFFNVITSSKDIRLSEENIQFIDKSLLTDDGYGYQSKFYIKLLKHFILSCTQSTRWKLISRMGYFKGLDHISELYDKMLQGKKIKIEAEPELKLDSDVINIDVKTEYATLKSVLLHKPGKEIKRVDPNNAKDLLFDQPVDYQKFLDQYSTFSAVMENITKLSGGEVVFVERLLSDILSDSVLGSYYRCSFILSLIDKDFVPLEKFWELIHYSPEEMLETAIAGKEDGFPCDPIPNFIFTRDNIIAVHDMIFLPTMTKKARKRENCLMEFILLNHAALKKSFASDFKVAKDNSFEGGDFILLDEETIFVGISDRTTIGSVRKFSEYIFNKRNPIKTVVGIEAFLQHERSMHLDTYMGVVGDYILILDEPLITSGDNTFYVFRRDEFDSENYPRIFLGNFDKLLREIKKDRIFEVIPVKEKREAYDDACNVLSVGKNKIVTYDRGTETISELGKRGFYKIKYNKGAGNSVWEKYKYEKEWIYTGNFTDLKDLYKEDEKYIFEVEGSELILARGGCHCMTMPLIRI